MPNVLDSIRAIIEYNWSDERADYERREQEGDDNEGHVFLHLLRVQEWLTSLKPPTPGEGELVLKLANGYELRSDSEQFQAGDYVRLHDPEGEEILHWSSDEWRLDPELVMGAILVAASDPDKVDFRKGG